MEPRLPREHFLTPEPVRPLGDAPAAFAELAQGPTDTIKIFNSGNA